MDENDEKACFKKLGLIRRLNRLKTVQGVETNVMLEKKGKKFRRADELYYLQKQIKK